MNLLNPRYWFQKRTGAFAAAGTEQMNRMRYNALFALDPNVLVRRLVAFNAGDIAGLEHVLEEFENREDKMKIGAFKMSAAVASKPWEVRIAKGEEDNERAKLHQEVLTRFWNRVEATDAFCRNRRGGVRLLVKQMMSAQSRVYACHDVTWTVRGDGELEALFTFVPAWMFENRTGELRFLKDPGAYTGVPMNDGEWLVTVGEGVGISAAILAMAKRLSWNDWLLFSEKCGMPVILGNTGAKEDTPAWKNLLHAIANVAPKTGILADLETKLQAVQVGGSSGQTTYRELIDVVDRGISALYRGGDLATVSQAGDSVGSNAQDGESELMDGDGCAMVSETLHRQIDRHVIRFTCGDFEPLAGIVINPPAETEDIDREIKIDTHLATLGVKLSKADALSRYGRTAATDDDDALQPVSNAPQNGLQPGFNGLPNEEQNKTPFKTDAKAFKNAQGDSDGQGDGSGLQELLGAFSRDIGPAAEEVKKLLADLDAGKDVTDAAKALAGKLPELMPEDPAMAAVIAEEMAKQFGAVELENEVQRVPSGHGNGGQFTGKTNQPRGKEPETKPQHDRYGSTDTEKLTADPKRNAERGDAAIKEIMRKKSGYVDNAMFRPEVGWIRFEWGDAGNPAPDEKGVTYKGGHGLSHIDAKAGHDVKDLPAVLSRGEIFKHENPDRLYVLHGTKYAVLRKLGKGHKVAITEFHSGHDPKKIEFIKNQPRAAKPGEN